jgi:hypothetical protein
LGVPQASCRWHRYRFLSVQLYGWRRRRIELHFVDRSGQLHTRADVPALGQTFEDIAHVLVPTASLDTSEREIVKVGPA